jgi:hypothetical protein
MPFIPARSKLRILLFKIKFKYCLYTIISKYVFLERMRRTLGGELSFELGRSKRDSMNHEEVLAVLPDSKDKAKSIKEIAQAMGRWRSPPTLDWIRAERQLVRALGALTKWGWVVCDERQKEEGRRFWHNAYWKTELAKE